jgi:putative hemolysin
MPVRVFLGLVVMLLLLAACASLPPILSPPAESAPTPESVAVEPGAQQIANPASQNCVAQGGTLNIEARGDGGQFGVCYFEDNRQCEEWALMRGECPVGGVKVTGYTTDAARYCVITGGAYTITANGGQADEQGACQLPGRALCDAAAYYNGQCDASTGQLAPNPVPAQSALALTPPIPEVCNGMAQALSEALSRANPARALLEVTQATEPVPMTDAATGAGGTGCRSTASGTGAQFASPNAVMQQISAVLTGGGWADERQQTSSGGPTGEGWGFRSADLVAYASVIWLPADSANCPEDRPISDCKVGPAQQIYTITLDTAQETETDPEGGESN